MRNVFLVLFLYLILLSCDSGNGKNQSQGIVEYSVSYVSNKSTIPTNLLPRKAILKFKGNKGITSIDGFMGMFSLTNITDFRKFTNTMMLKVMDNKYFYPGEKYASPFYFDSICNFKLKMLDETKIIAGFKCKKATVVFADSTQLPFDIFYTDELTIKNPNKATPFNEIGGVLMQFNIRITNIEMRLTAKGYKSEKIPEDIFKIPKGYRRVSREKISGVLVKLLE
jgi:GLPGLI family protein